MPTDSDRLMLQMSADIRGLEKQLAKAGAITDKSVTGMQRKLNSIKVQPSGGLGVGLAKDLGALTGRAASAGASVTGLGNTLSSLGPYGMAAAVAIGVVTAAFATLMVKGREALDWVDKIGDTAGKLHISAEALQEWHFAAEDAGLSAEDFDGALGAIQASVGKFTSGVGDGRVKKAFAELNITPDDLKGLHSWTEVLDLVGEHLKGVQSEAERVQIAKALGGENITTLLEMGDAMAGLRARAQELGLVIDNDTVKSMGDMQRQAELASQMIDVELKKAFLNVAPVVLQMTQYVADLARELNHFIDQFKKAEDRSVSSLRSEAANQRKLAASHSPQAFLENEGHDIATGKPVGTTRRARGGFADSLEWEADKKLIASAAAERASDPHLQGGGSGSAATGGGGRHGASSARQQIDRSDQAIAQAMAEELGAHVGMLRATLDAADKTQQQSAVLEQIAALESQEVTAKQTQRDERTRNDKSLSSAAKAQLLSLSAATADEERRAVAMKLQKDTDQNFLDVSKLAFENNSKILDLEIDRLQTMADSATTEKARAAIERQILGIRQRQAKTALITEQDQAILNGEQTPAGKKAVLGALAGQHAAQNSAFDAQHPSMLQKGRDDARGEADSTAADIIKTDDIAGRYAEMYAQIDQLRKEDTLSEEQAERAKAQINARYNEEKLANASNFFGTLAQLSNSGNRKLAAIGKAAAIAQATIDGFVAVQKALASAPPPFNFALAAAVGVVTAANVAHIAGVKGFATGTDSAPGGMAWVGERGPELVNLPRGSQVIPNNVLNNISKMPQLAMGGATRIVVELHVKPGQAFDAEVLRAATPALQAATEVAVHGGAALAQQQASRRSARRLAFS